MDNLDQYDFFLPPELIATAALSDRSACRLMYLGQGQKKPVHDVFKNIGNYLRPSDVLVVNNTKVMRARIFAYDMSEKIELLLARPLPNGHWTALIYGGRGSNPHMPGKTFRLKLTDDAPTIKIVSEQKENNVYEIACDADLGEYAESCGELPIPPYFRRKAEKSDDIDYQTVYAKHLGAVAAPTAGLHFTVGLLNDLRRKGVTIVEITLHVGPGTFLPIRTKNIEDHKMHAEYFFVDDKCAETLNRARDQNQRIIPVGSTAMRVLEHVIELARAKNSDRFFACEGETSIFIRPGHKFLACDGIITNFHIPRSTLILLVSAIAGRERVLDAYKEAIAQKYRFYSYGDACFFESHSRQ